MALSEYTETTSSALVDRWQRGYATRLFATDLLVLVVVVYGSQFLRFGADAAEQLIARSEAQRFEITYSLVSALLIVAWLAALGLFGTRDQKIIGSGSTEYKRIADATIRVFGVLAIIAFLLQAQLGRGYLLIALPTGLALLLASRWLWRQWLNRRRAEGEYSYRAILMGERASSAHVARQIMRDPSNGFVIVGAVTQGGSAGELAPGVPVLGSYDRAIEAVDASEADTVVFTGADMISPRQLRQFGWDLETRSVNLIVAPALTDVAGPRIHARPVAGLPLIHVDYPVFEGNKYAAKRAFDLIASFAGLVLLSPLFLALTILIRSDSHGPAVFRQERVGLNGRRFKMLKFRSMVVDAEQQLPSLLDQSEGNGVLFKLKSDPRVTKVGAILRKYSLDELPQLVNVLRGDMSLVGPRPPLASEVERYDESAQRRLLVKPGITGLWQTEGRSNLSWDDSVRLDLYYVENWSLTGDIILLYRTVRAVARPDGAY
ncbi:sugar transferase [Agromyces sp. SYSU K20354]|uniref:sugar transferase n=1 Tax=Agromyces cavernae TaxID=2898659 RepID=UPI001E5CD663|nr:sugar transferase [Agromyces cavernae]MCD2444224.1 sugar transferase [Agromyces cavernae]